MRTGLADTSRCGRLFDFLRGAAFPLLRSFHYTLRAFRMRTTARNTQISANPYICASAALRRPSDGRASRIACTHCIQRGVERNARGLADTSRCGNVFGILCGQRSRLLALFTVGYGLSGSARRRGIHKSLRSLTSSLRRRCDGRVTGARPARIACPLASRSA